MDGGEVLCLCVAGGTWELSYFLLNFSVNLKLLLKKKGLLKKYIQVGVKQGTHVGSSLDHILTQIIVNIY